MRFTRPVQNTVTAAVKEATPRNWTQHSTGWKRGVVIGGFIIAGTTTPSWDDADAYLEFNDFNDHYLNRKYKNVQTDIDSYIVEMQDLHISPTVREFLLDKELFRRRVLHLLNLSGSKEFGLKHGLVTYLKNNYLNNNWPKTVEEKIEKFISGS